MPGQSHSAMTFQAIAHDTLRAALSTANAPLDPGLVLSQEDAERTELSNLLRRRAGSPSGW
jgi:hypothetical protein